MSAPKFVPVMPVGAFRDTEGLPPALAWNADRPAEVAVHQPRGRRMGTPGPDQGYALKLANLFHGKLALVDGEDEHDVVLGCLGIALRRAAAYGRSPVIHDLELAFAVFGFTGPAAPIDLVAFRTPMFEAAGHQYEVQRALTDLVPETTLRMTPDAVKQTVAAGQWRSLIEGDS